MCSLKKSPIAFGKDGIKSHSPPASAHCCRSIFHVWSQACISKTNNLVSFLTVIHNANKTACERAQSPKRRLTARGGERKRKRERTEQLRLSAPCLIDFCLSSFFTAPPLPVFQPVFNTLFLTTHTPKVEWHTCSGFVVTTAWDLYQHCCYLLAY